MSVVVVVALLSGMGKACEFVQGYFHQVTATRGRVVGKDLKLAPLLRLRWLRQSYTVSDATLTLFEYRSPAKVEDLKQNIVVTSSDVMGAWFDVEVTDAVKATESIAIDVSPINPDCTGGHEFIEKEL